MSDRWDAPHCRTNPETGGNVLMACPTCRRRTHADKIIDLSGVEPSVVAAWGVGGAVCDACRARLHRNGVVDRAAFIEALGAPAEQVERAREKLAAHSRGTV